MNSIRRWGCIFFAYCRWGEFRGAAITAVAAVGMCLAAAGGAQAQTVVDNTTSAYQAHIRINDVGSDSRTKTVQLPLGKSVIVSMPRDVRDVLVSDPEVVDAIIRGPRTIYITGVANGDSSLFFFDRHGKQMLVLDARVAQDMTELRQVLRHTLPNADIQVNQFGENVVLSGTVDSAASADMAAEIANKYMGGEDNVVNGLTLSQGQQVLLRVRVAEMSRTTVRQLGIDFGLSNAMNGIYRIAASLPSTFTANAGFLGGAEATIAGPSGSSGRWSMLIQAMERSGIFRTLAEPTLTALSGQEAEFLAGGEIPFPVASADGTVSVQFKSYGVALSFAPVVLENGRISLKIGTSVSDVSIDNPVSVGNQDVTTVVPSLRVRRAASTVEVPSGGSIMMAGLLQDRLRQSLDGAPWLKDIPVLGALFRSRDYIDEATELVVIVSPLIVEPYEDNTLDSPTDNFAPANELNAMFWGELYRSYTVPETPVEQYTGEVGFVLE